MDSQKSKCFYTMVIYENNNLDLENFNEFYKNEILTSCYVKHKICKKFTDKEHRHYIFQIKKSDENYKRLFKRYKLPEVLGLKYKVTSIENYIKYLKFSEDEDGLYEDKIRGELVTDFNIYKDFWNESKISKNKIEEKIRVKTKKIMEKKEKKMSINNLLLKIVKDYNMKCTSDIVDLYVKIERRLEKNLKLDIDFDFDLLKDLMNDYIENMPYYEKKIENIIKYNKQLKNAISNDILKNEGVLEVYENEYNNIKNKKIDEEILKNTTEVLKEIYTTDFIKNIPASELPSDLDKIDKKKINNFAKLNKHILERKFQKVGGICLTGPTSVGKSLLIDNFTSGFLPGIISQSVSKESSFRYEGLVDNSILKLEEYSIRSNDDVQQLKTILNNSDDATVGRKGKVDGTLKDNRITFIATNNNLLNKIEGSLEDKKALSERLLILNLIKPIRFSTNNINKETMLKAHIDAFKYALTCEKENEIKPEDIDNVLVLCKKDLDDIKLDADELRKYNKLNTNLNDLSNVEYYAWKDLHDRYIKSAMIQMDMTKLNMRLIGTKLNKACKTIYK